MESTGPPVGPPTSLRFGLFPDVTSQGVLMGGSDQAAEACSLRVGSLLHETDGHAKSHGTEGPKEELISEKQSEESYGQWFKEALEWFESEIDDDSDEEGE